MPCYDHRDQEPRIIYSGEADPTIEDALNDKIARLNQKVAKLEASLCAMMTELEDTGLLHGVITKASRHGLIDLMKFWEDHNKSDTARVAKKLHEFSVHEQAILKELLK